MEYFSHVNPWWKVSYWKFSQSNSLHTARSIRPISSRHLFPSSSFLHVIYFQVHYFFMSFISKFIISSRHLFPSSLFLHAIYFQVHNFFTSFICRLIISKEHDSRYIFQNRVFETFWNLSNIKSAIVLTISNSVSRNSLK